MIQVRPPKHAAGCRGAEDVTLGHPGACRACEWFAEVERLVDAVEDLLPFVRADDVRATGCIPDDDVDRVRESLRRLESIR